MENESAQSRLPAPKEPIRLPGKNAGTLRRFFGFLMMLGLLTAAIAVFFLWDDCEAFLEPMEAWFQREKQPLQPSEDLPDVDVRDAPPEKSPTENPPQENPKGESKEEVETELPAGAVTVLRKDLSARDLGEGYVHNLSVFSPQIEAEFEKQAVLPSVPTVLILATHTSECYGNGVYLQSPPGDSTYSTDSSENMIAVGRTLAEALNRAGVSTLLCTAYHDRPTLQGAYERSAETVRAYLDAYPHLQYVIDLHRDAVLEGDAYVGAVTEKEGVPYAQILPVVGSDGDGKTDYDWENNLAFAKKLKAVLEEECPNICRPISLRNSSYNQELSPHALLLEIGTGGNTVEEAKRSAELLGEVLGKMLK